jgi:hypothetical protein
MAVNKRIPELEERSSATSGMKLAAYDPETDTTIALLVSALLPSASDESFAWDPETTYAEDQVSVYEDQIYVSLQNGNLDHLPNEVGSLFWSLGVRGVSGLVPWVAGIFTQTHVTVLKKTSGRWSLYYLENATRPFNSTNFTTELDAGDWLPVRGPDAVINLGDYDATGDLYPDDGTAVGTGVGGAIVKNNEFNVPAGGVSLDRGTGVEFIPGGTTLRALVDNPGQTPANWKSY